MIEAKACTGLCDISTAGPWTYHSPHTARNSGPRRNGEARGSHEPATSAEGPWEPFPARRRHHGHGPRVPKEQRTRKKTSSQSLYPASTTLTSSGET
eukprot:9480476-Pyramimonas_sp.AAC.1